MRAWLNGKTFVLTAALLALVTLSSSDVQSQQRRTSRRVTHPVRPRPVATPAPSSADPTLVSTAVEPEAEQPRPKRAVPQPADAQQNETRRELEAVTAEVQRLNKQMATMEKQRRVDLLEERLTRAEQRSESLQTQLRDVMEKQANTQAQVERVDEQMRPESLERSLALVGTFRPDEARASLQRQLEAEKKRLQGLMDALDKNRQRLETSLTHADQVVDGLRSELEQALQREREGNADADTERPARAPRPAPVNNTNTAAEPSAPPPHER